MEGLPGQAGDLDVRQLGALELAFVGDTLHDFFVRTYLIRRGGRVSGLHRKATALVNAGAQAHMLELLMPRLTEAEQDVARRGRNTHAHHKTPRGATHAQYQASTALEALWGYLYLSGQQERLQALFDIGLSLIQDAEEQSGRKP